MFTGIVEEVGAIVEITGRGDSRRVAIGAELVSRQMKLGESIAVNGVCLTVARLSVPVFMADLSPETVERSNLSALRPGERVNLERALQVGGRLGGHFVTGHVDGIGSVESKSTEGDFAVIEGRAPRELMRHVAAKGSIAIDGISLTVAACTPDCFSVSLIPHTMRSTAMGGKEAGALVNLECDILSKYVERLLQFGGPSPGEKGSTLTLEFLEKMGF